MDEESSWNPSKLNHQLKMYMAKTITKMVIGCNRFCVHTNEVKVEIEVIYPDYNVNASMENHAGILTKWIRMMPSADQTAEGIAINKC